MNGKDSEATSRLIWTTNLQHDNYLLSWKNSLECSDNEQLCIITDGDIRKIMEKRDNPCHAKDLKIWRSILPLTNMDFNGNLKLVMEDSGQVTPDLLKEHRLFMDFIQQFGDLKTMGSKLKELQLSNKDFYNNYGQPSSFVVFTSLNDIGRMENFTKVDLGRFFRSDEMAHTTGSAKAVVYTGYSTLAKMEDIEVPINGTSSRDHGAVTYRNNPNRTCYPIQMIKGTRNGIQRNVKMTIIQPEKIHQSSESLFSTASGFSNFRGFLNLAMILLVLTSTRAALENVIKYGVLVNPLPFVEFLKANIHNLPAIVIVLFCNMNIAIALYIEKMLSVSKISELFGQLFHCINLVCELALPVLVILSAHPNPVCSSLALLFCVIVFLKLVSFKQTLRTCRIHMNDFINSLQSRHQSTDLSTIITNYGNATVMYINNLNFTNMYYFIATPTLCYELYFPRIHRIRKHFLGKRLVESLFITGVILAAIQQWVHPVVHNAVTPFSQMDLSRILERILKLALPNFFIWLMWFYLTFHSLLNILAELLTYGDRTFYKDWWNSESISEFWKKWNIPVHKWAIRHVYKPLLSYRYSKLQSQLIVFVISAFFHELLVSVPLGLFRCYAFIGMLMQVPLAVFTAKVNKRSAKMCNVVVWMSLIFGQTIALLMYYVDYYIITHVPLYEI